MHRKFVIFTTTPRPNARRFRDHLRPPSWAPLRLRARRSSRLRDVPNDPSTPSSTANVFADPRRTSRPTTPRLRGTLATSLPHTVPGGRRVKQDPSPATGLQRNSEETKIRISFSHQQATATLPATFFKVREGWLCIPRNTSSCTSPDPAFPRFHFSGTGISSPAPTPPALTAKRDRQSGRPSRICIARIVGIQIRRKNRSDVHGFPRRPSLPVHTSRRLPGERLGQSGRNLAHGRRSTRPCFTPNGDHVTRAVRRGSTKLKSENYNVLKTHFQRLRKPS